MCEEQEDVFYYLTVMNENYVQPATARGRRGGDPARDLPPARGSGRRPAGAAPRLGRDPARGDRGRRAARGRLRHRERRLERDELHRAAPRGARGRAMEPAASDRGAARLLRRGTLRGPGGPFVAATDYMRAFADQIRPFVPGRYSVLGTDGFGRSDYRVKLRQFFEVDRYHVAVTALKALADDGRRRADGRAGCDRALRHRRRSSTRPGALSSGVERAVPTWRVRSTTHPQHRLNSGRRPGLS